MALPSPSKEEKEARVVSKLSEVTEKFKWYSLKLPGLEDLLPRVGHSLVSLENSKVLMIGGGNHYGAFNHVITVNLERDSEDDKDVIIHPAGNNFPSKYEFLCAKDWNKNCVWVFGGADTSDATDTIIRIDHETVETIKCSKENAPSPRTQGNNSAILEWQGKTCLAVFSGGLRGDLPVPDRDLYLFDTNELKWEKVVVREEVETVDLPFANQPPYIQGHIMTAAGSKILVHGGIIRSTLYDGFHLLDLKKENDDSSFSWVNLNAIDASSTKLNARAAHGTAKMSDVDKSSPLLYIFGGLGENGSYNDLWSFNVDSMSWNQVMKNSPKGDLPVNVPPPRLDFAMCAVKGRSSPDSTTEDPIYIMLHGGMNREGVIFTDAWLMRVQ